MYSEKRAGQNCFAELPRYVRIVPRWAPILREQNSYGITSIFASPLELEQKTK